VVRLLVEKKCDLNLREKVFSCYYVLSDNFYSIKNIRADSDAGHTFFSFELVTLLTITMQLFLFQFTLLYRMAGRHCIGRVVKVTWTY